MAKKPKRKSTKPPKIPNVIESVRLAVKLGNIRYMPHAISREMSRDITRFEYLNVLKTGHHEKSKDEFKDEFNAWNYAIRGRSLEGRDIRVAISFDEDDMLIITVIEVAKR